MFQDSLPLPALFSQTNRLFRLQSPLGDALLLDAFQGTEGLSVPFRYTLQLLSERADLSLDDLAGAEMQVFLATGSGERCFSGQVLTFARTGADGGFAFYEATLGPWTEFMARRVNCRIFQQKSLPELVRALLGEYGGLARYQLDLALEQYPPLTHCTQYNESDFAFLSRLLEAHGIHYFFRHDPQGHTLVLADLSRSAGPMPVRDRIAFNTEPAAGGSDTIDRWGCRVAVVATAYAIKSFDFRNPGDSPESRAAASGPGARAPELERYEHAGSFAFADGEAGQRLARQRLEEETRRRRVYDGAGNCRFLTCGHTFELLEHFSQGEADRRFLVTAVAHEGANNYRDQAGRPCYRNRFECMPADIPFRPPLATPCPAMKGPQTATVVGPPGEEIFCDPFGRVKVQFHWDREGRHTDASSCWVRVASPLAGHHFGMIALPRVGHEVLVDFLEGNPDRPIITGQAYNAVNLPPWELPAHRTRSGILTRSSLGGAYENANGLCFDDRKGAEEVWLHAEKDQRIEVEHDEAHQVDHDRRKRIGHDETTRVQHDRTETVGHDETLSVGHDRTGTIGADEALTVHGHQHLDVGRTQTIQVGMAKTETVGLASTELVGGAKSLGVGAAYLVNVGAAKNEAVGLGSCEEVGLDKRTSVGQVYRITAGDRLELTVGQSRLVLAADGTITLSGLKVAITGSQQVKVEGKAVDVNG